MIKGVVVGETKIILQRGNIRGNSLKNNMKISQFIIATEQDDNPNTYLLYNTHTTAFVAMEKEKYNKIFIEKDFKEDCVQQLHKMGFLIDDDFDELAALEELRIKGMSDPVQNVTLLTTTECNARCYYCFENGIKQYPMTKKVADATIQYIIKNYPEPQFAINWFGGEPLMNFEIMKYITEELKKAGYDLIAHITTNGSLLTEEMLEYFQKEYSDLSFQITIDENGEKYGKIKRYVDIDAKDAYKRVINNVCMLLDHHVTTNVRLNFAASKIERAKEIYIQLKKEFEGHDNSSLYIYFAPLTLDSDNEIISDFHGDMEHPFLQAVKTQFSEGFPLYKPRYDGDMGLIGAFGLMPNAFSCGMTTKNRISIDADGTLYKCHRLSGKKEFACGTVFDGISEDNSIYRIFRNTTIEDEECKKCNLLPICQGGCKSQRILYGNKQKCHRIRQIQKELVNLYYKEMSKKM